MEEPTKKKIFISAIGSLGDVKPFVILAKELKKRGHIVWLGVHQRFEEQVKAEGRTSIELIRFSLNEYVNFRSRYSSHWW